MSIFILISLTVFISCKNDTTVDTTGAESVVDYVKYPSISNFSAKAKYAGLNLLTWDAPRKSSGITIYRKINDGDMETIKTGLKNVTKYADCLSSNAKAWKVGDTVTYYIQNIGSVTQAGQGSPIPAGVTTDSKIVKAAPLRIRSKYDPKKYLSKLPYDIDFSSCVKSVSKGVNKGYNYYIDLGRNYDLYKYVSYRIVSNGKEGDTVTFNLGGKSGGKARSLARDDIGGFGIPSKEELEEQIGQTLTEEEYQQMIEQLQGGGDGDGGDWQGGGSDWQDDDGSGQDYPGYNDGGDSGQGGGGSGDWQDNDDGDDDDSGQGGSGGSSSVVSTSRIIALTPIAEGKNEVYITIKDNNGYYTQRDYYAGSFTTTKTHSYSMGAKFMVGDSGTVSTTFDETPSGTPGDNKVTAGDGSVKIYAKWDSVTDENQVPVDATYFLYYIENGLYTEISAEGAKKDTNATYANADNKVVGKVTYEKETPLLPKKSAFAKGEGDKSLTFALYAVVKGELVGKKSGGQVTVKSGKDDASSSGQ